MSKQTAQGVFAAENLVEGGGLHRRWGGQASLSKGSGSSGQGPLRQLWGVRLERWAESV